MTVLALVVLLAAACSVGAAASPVPLGSYANPLAHGGPGILTLAEGGQYANIVSETDRTPAKGTWKVTGDQLQFTETPGGDCTGIQGTYKWAFDGTALRFWLVQDTCTPRAGDFTSGAWTRVPSLGSYTNDKTDWGTLVLTLADGGQFTLHIGLEDRLIHGIWKATGDQIELTATDGGCPNIKGTYKWALDGNALTFQQVHDSCLYNAAAFDSQTWIRQP
jgi:hypothetical protein